MTSMLLLAIAGLSGGILVVAAWLLLRVSDRDVLLAARISAAQGKWHKPEAIQAPRRSMAEPLQRTVASIGHAVMQSGILPLRTRADLQRTLAASGFRGSNALALFLGAKLVLMLAGPAAGWALANMLGTQNSTRILFVGIGFVAGLLVPEMIVRRLRTNYLAQLSTGLPDALDLLVICAQAGLNLESAIARVASEMRASNKAVADELELTVRELEMMASAAAALANFAQRTELDTVKRLVSTLTQTMQYGTPLTDALRTLSAETRQTVLTEYEARAARLPVLLTLPMIVFILPCVFIVVGGPAVIQIMKTFGH